MITTPSKQLLITSVNKAIDMAKMTGVFNTRVLNLYNLYIEYIDFTEGKVEYNDENQFLKERLSILKYKYPNILCNYKLRIISGNTITRVGNTAPTVSDNTIDLDGIFIRPFRIEDFTKDFSDNEFDSWNKIMIIIDSEPVINKLYYIDTINDTTTPYPVPVTRNMEIPYSLINNLIFIEPQGDSEETINYNETNYIVNFRISDDYIPNSLYSARQKVTIINSKYEENYPPTIGDITITTDNRATTIITMTMFTTLMAPPYNDPEGDLIDAIRINSVSTANKGKFYFDNNPIQNGDIISKNDINNGLFTHIGANVDTLAGDNLDFSIRDEGSHQWVD